MRVVARQIGALIALSLILPFAARAQSASQLQQQINERSTQIDQLDKEIAQYQAQLDATSEKKQTLQTQLSQLNLTIKKTNASISRTKSQIASTELQIQQLATGITNAQSSIDSEHLGLAESIRALDEEESRPLALQMLSGGTIATVWRDLETSQSLQIAIYDHIVTLASAKKTLSDTKAATEEKRAQLLKQQKTLQTQQGSLSATKLAQSELLAQTKSQESTYQAIIVQKKAQQESFEQALEDLKSQYQQVVNPSDITTPGKGILQWPLDSVRITQYFGNTAFAASGAYNGKGHNGIDFAAPIGTPLRAALSGVILGTGNTDVAKNGGKQCYSFGKWVFIKHANGLGTMYAHLSQINVSEGQNVSTGQLIGYTGETGYATGPHLHFGVYVAAATQIIKLGDATQSATPCANAVMPVTPLSGYLNPLNYLPAL